MAAGSTFRARAVADHFFGMEGEFCRYYTGWYRNDAVAYYHYNGGQGLAEIGFG
jgi:hypothetical protein